MSPFGRYLQLLRIKRHIKQKELADAIGVNPSYISLLETGRKLPPSSKI